MSAGILGYATYLPVWRIDPDGSGRARRPVAGFDEDSTTMAVEAASVLLRAAGPGAPVPTLMFATSSPPYADKTNASAVHAALALDAAIPVADLVGTARSAVAGLRFAASGGGLVAAADVRVGKPGSADERAGCDGAAAVLLGHGTAELPVLAEILSIDGVTDEFLDRWRDPGRPTGDRWEERFGLDRYTALVRRAAAQALAGAGLAEADHVVVTSPNPAVGKRAVTLLKGRLSTSGPPVGFLGAADPLMALASVLDRAAPGETVLLLSAADGCDAVLLRATEALPARRQPTPVADAAGVGRVAPYPKYLSWRGLLDIELPRRPEPDRPAAPPSARGAAWKFGLHGTRCRDCGFVHLPPARVCRGCGATDRMNAHPVSGLRARVATYTVDRLAYSPSPPVVDVVVDFGERAGGGRSTFEVADADPASIDIGTPVSLAFRRLFTAGGVHNYFWKARRAEEDR